MIVVDRVSKYYGNRPAVRDLDFTIQEGECIGLLGLNGQGKSTALRLLSCLLLPTSGRITIQGFDVEEQPHEIRKLIGYLPDRPPLYPEMRVESFLRFAGKLRRMSGREVRARLSQVIETTGLEDVVDQLIGTLSHGFQQRVGIAQAIIHRPTLLILDEPIQGLDPVQIRDMRELIRALRGEHTVLLSSHMLAEIERTCDRILMMDRGTIVAEGSERDVAARIAEMATLEQVALHETEVEVRGTEDAVRSALAIDGLEITGIDLLGDVVRVKARSSSDAQEEIARRVIGANLGLVSLRRSSSLLEEAFGRLSEHADRARDEVRA